jgi:hypothetical protein
MHRLSVALVREAIDAAVNRDYVGPGGRGILDLEIVAGANGRHRLRGLAGHRTAGRFDASPLALPWLSWLSEDSIFVEVESTPGRFGGKRYWFRCPRPSCGCRCSVLYREQNTNARAFSCRICAGMRYATQVFGRSELTLHRVARKLVKLQFTPGERIKRPKGMHRRTFERLRREVEPSVRLWQNSDPFVKHMTAFSKELDASIRRSGSIVPHTRLPKLRWKP